MYIKFFLQSAPTGATFSSRVLFTQLKQSNLLSFAEQQPAERAQSWRWSGAYVVTVSLCCLGCCCLTALNSVSDVVTNHCAMCAVSKPAASLPEIVSNYSNNLLGWGSQCEGTATMIETNPWQQIECGCQQQTRFAAWWIIVNPLHFLYIVPHNGCTLCTLLLSFRGNRFSSFIITTFIFHFHTASLTVCAFFSISAAWWWNITVLSCCEHV